MLRPDRTLLRSIALLAAIYAVLAVPWPGLGPAFVTAYAAVAQAAVAHSVPMRGTTFRATAPGEVASEWDLAIRLPPEPGATTIHGIRLHMRRIAYLPLALLAALAVAFPRGESRARLYGAFACPAILAALQLVAILSVFTARGILDLSLTGNVLVMLVSRAFFEAPGMAFVIPALLWVLLARPPVAMQTAALLPAR